MKKKSNTSPIRVLLASTCRDVFHLVRKCIVATLLITASRFLYKGVQILESGKFLLAELGILALENHANDWNSESKFYRQKIRNPVPGTRNPYKDLNPESKFHWQTQTGIQYLESGIHCVESRIQDCIGFPYMGQSRFVLRWCYTRRFATNDFQRNTALQCWNNVATIWSNVATML